MCKIMDVLLIIWIFVCFVVGFAIYAIVMTQWIAALSGRFSVPKQYSHPLLRLQTERQQQPKQKRPCQQQQWLLWLRLQKKHQQLQIEYDKGQKLPESAIGPLLIPEK